ncbi:ABC transporter permease [Kordiimonas marina]|uniref:ABC transporter permease n=1 Tax=Kordiimonas marina TaxID=2872312 RepID=UPI001FF57309|nr:ABC transporter permease subunit [Kordiimonas marina]MCJ9430072.1 ABC transporter permease subunit [Kordiimonas marina]
MIASDARLAINPNDKVLPSFSHMADAIVRMATKPDRRSGDLLLWSDTFASLRRLFIGVGAGALVGLMVGLNTAIFPGLRAMSRSFLTFLSIIPPLTLLPILFIAFGVGETAKVMLIFIGTVFVISRDLHLYVLQLPKEQITKALTLGASDLAVTYRIVLPQIMPRLIETTRLTLGGAWLFLIAAEMISATEGLGYRIGLVRRYLAMDVIIPYVLWITLLGFLLDWLLRLAVARLYPWYRTGKE